MSNLLPWSSELRIFLKSFKFLNRKGFSLGDHTNPPNEFYRPLHSPPPFRESFAEPSPRHHRPQSHANASESQIPSRSSRHQLRYRQTGRTSPSTAVQPQTIVHTRRFQTASVRALHNLH